MGALSQYQLNFHKTPVVQKVDSAIHWRNHYLVNNAIGFGTTYLLDSDLSGGYKHYQPFEQPGPGITLSGERSKNKHNKGKLAGKI